MEQGTLANGEEITYTINTDIITVKITPKDLFARSLELKLQLYSNALIQFSIISRGIGRASIPEAFLENLSGAAILQ